MNRGFSVLLLTFMVLPLLSQTLRRPVAAPYINLGAYSQHHTDVFSFTSNQAALAQLDQSAIGVYGERRFMLSEISNYVAAAGLKTTSGNFGLKTSYFGFSDYNETQLGLAYGRKLGTKAAVGIQFNYNSIRIPTYGNASAISVEAGSIVHLTDKIHAGVQVNNPIGGKFGKDQQEKLPSVYTFGIGYEASELFFVSTEIVKEEDQPVNVNAGIQYKVIPQLLVRAGVATATSTVWAGAGFTFKALRIDVSASYHSQLGITPGLLLLFNFNTPGK